MAIMPLDKDGNGKDRLLQRRRDYDCIPCYAWMHFAGGETSADRPGATGMMSLVSFCRVAESDPGTKKLARLSQFRMPLSEVGPTGYARVGDDVPDIR